MKPAKKPATTSRDILAKVSSNSIKIPKQSGQKNSCARKQTVAQDDGAPVESQSPGGSKALINARISVLVSTLVSTIKLRKRYWKTAAKK
jgi:hypothetical protein